MRLVEWYSMVDCCLLVRAETKWVEPEVVKCSMSTDPVCDLWTLLATKMVSRSQTLYLKKQSTWQIGSLFVVLNIQWSPVVYTDLKNPI